MCLSPVTNLFISNDKHVYLQQQTRSSPARNVFALYFVADQYCICQIPWIMVLILLPTSCTCTINQTLLDCHLVEYQLPEKEAIKDITAIALARREIELVRLNLYVHCFYYSVGQPARTHCT